MRKNVDYNLLVQAERIRFHSDFSSAHWLHQVISMYELGIQNKLRLDAFERVLRCAIKFGVRTAVELSRTFPDVAGFPQYLRLAGGPQWKKTKRAILDDFQRHTQERFRYVREGD